MHNSRSALHLPGVGYTSSTVVVWAHICGHTTKEEVAGTKLSASGCAGNASFLTEA